MNERRRILGRWRWLLPMVALVVFGGWWAMRASGAGAGGEWARVEWGDLVLGIDVNGTLPQGRAALVEARPE